MLDALKVVSPSKATNDIPLKNLYSLSETAQKLYLALSLAAEKVKEHRGYHPKTTQVTYFCPVEAVALSIGVTRQTVYNRLPELVESGLVAQRGHFCTHRGSTRSDGSLWAVKLSPEMPGRAKISYDYLKKQGYRNLEADIQTSRTAWSLLQSKPNKAKSVEIDYILAFAINPSDSNSKTYDCKTAEVSSLETLLDLPYVPLEGRGQAVDSTARAISASLGSPESSLMFWRWLLWQLLRLEQLEKSYFYQIFLIVQRASVERRENACKNSAGLAVSWLKKSPVWDELRSVAPNRIGRKPRDLS